LGFSSFRSGQDLCLPRTSVQDGTASPLRSGGFGGDPNYNRPSNSVGYFLPSPWWLLWPSDDAINEYTKYSPGTSSPPGANASGGLNSGTVTAARG